MFGARSENLRLAPQTKAFTLANHDYGNPSNEPIRTRSKYTVADSKRGKTRANKSELVLVLLQIG